MVSQNVFRYVRINVPPHVKELPALTLKTVE